MQIYSVYKAKKMIMSTLIALIFGVLFSLYSAQSKVGIISGITVCTTMVIPSLFPFMALCNFFCLSGGAEFLSRMLKYPVKLLMGRYYEFFWVYLVSLVGGYPVGASTLNNLVKSGKTDKDTAKTVLMFSVNSSPAFLVFGVGEGMLFSNELGWYLVLVNMLSSIITLVLVSRIAPKITKNYPTYKKGATKYMSLNDAFVEGVMKASISMLFLCGFVVLFFALNEIFAFMPFGKLTAVISVVGEVTSSCAMLSSGGGTLPLIAGITSFGGVCVLFQILALSKEFRPKLWVLILTQFAKGVLSYFIMWGLIILLPEIGLMRYENALSNMSSPGKFGISSTPITSVCIVLTAVTMLYYTIKILSNKENKTNEEFGIHK